jgi:hypothetical protein
MRRAVSFASIALKIRLKPQLSHAESMAKRATQAMAARGERGMEARAAISRYTGRVVAAT